MSEEKKTKPGFKVRFKESVERVKTHIRENKVVYISVGASVASSVVTYILTSESNKGTTMIGGGDANSTIENVVAVNSPITVEQHTNVVNNFGGHMVKLVKCVETGEIFGSVNDAAEAAGVTRSGMSNHLNGRSDHIYGNHYEIVGLGTTT